jgi:uncharacterized membrane protein
MGYTDYLTREQRLARIGALLAKGIYLMLSREAEEMRQLELQASASGTDPGVRNSNNQTVTNGMSQSDEDDRRIIEYLRRVESASPRHMHRALSMSKATLFRRLTELMTAGLVMRAGKTTGVQYRLVEHHNRYAERSKSLPQQGSGPNGFERSIK